MFEPDLRDEKTIPQSALKFLKPNDVVLIERALEKAGPCCELHLIVDKGQIRYISLLQIDSKVVIVEDTPK